MRISWNSIYLLLHEGYEFVAYYSHRASSYGYSLFIVNNNAACFQAAYNGFMEFKNLEFTGRTGEKKAVRLAFEENPLPPGMGALVDLFTGQEVPNFATEPMIRLPVSRYVATARTVSAGRIFVYVK